MQSLERLGSGERMPRDLLGNWLGLNVLPIRINVLIRTRKVIVYLADVFVLS
jgi:hypothetical protein